MCPACIATAALIVAGATSGGGLAALAMETLRGATGAGETERMIKGLLGELGTPALAGTELRKE